MVAFRGPVSSVNFFKKQISFFGFVSEKHKKKSRIFSFCVFQTKTNRALDGYHKREPPNNSFVNNNNTNFCGGFNLSLSRLPPPNNSFINNVNTNF